MAGKFYDIDPETCSLEELKAAIEHVENKEEYYHTMEQSAKVFINSVYGVFGTDFFNLANTDLAESVTLQGQHLIKFSTVKINDYFKNRWRDDIEAQENVIAEMKKTYPDFDGKTFKRLVKETPLMFDTLQCYGDSVTGDSVIQTIRGGRTIENIFKDAVSKYSGFDTYNTLEKIRVKCDEVVLHYDLATDEKIYSPVKYVMRHAYKGKMYKFYIKGDYKPICVTADHSMIVKGETSPVSPGDIKVGSRVIVNYKWSLSTPHMCEVSSIIEYDQEDFIFVYDLCMNTDDDNQHNFFANNILVHNTDSVAANSKVITEKHPEGLEISLFYDENSDNLGESTSAGHVSVHTADKVLNIVNGNPVYTPVKRIIKHNVNKPKWLISTKLGNKIYCTEDHSMIIYNREGQEYRVRPIDILPGDRVALYINGAIDLDEISGCRQDGYFENEYVYDIETGDETHTFVANNILVHNSAYVTLNPLIKAYNIPNEQETDFDIAIYKGAMEGMLNDAFEQYAKAFNCDKNLEVFELEKISRSIIMLAKKNYMCDVAWVDTGDHLPPLSHVTYTGYDVVKGGTPDFCREEMKKFTEFVLEKLNKGVKPTQGEIVKKLREIKTRFAMQSPNEISISKSMSNYETFVKDDKSSQTIEYFEIRNKNGTIIPAPIHVRAAAIYNNMLFNKAKKYITKYNLLKSGDKVKMYYINENEVFGFVPDHYPAEFAPKMDLDTQFDKVLLSPLNRIVSALGYSEIPPTLTYTSRLF